MPNPINDQKLASAGVVSDYQSADDKFSQNQPSFYPERQYVERRGPLHQSDIPVGTIKQRHIEPNALLVFTGLAANRPDGSGWVKAYFAVDSGVLSLWNGTSWLTTTLT